MDLTRTHQGEGYLSLILDLCLLLSDMLVSVGLYMGEGMRALPR